jgi:hypothetical protein
MNKGWALTGPCTTIISDLLRVYATKPYQLLKVMQLFWGGGADDVKFSHNRQLPNSKELKDAKTIHLSVKPSRSMHSKSVTNVRNKRKQLVKWSLWPVLHIMKAQSSRSKSATKLLRQFYSDLTPPPPPTTTSDPEEIKVSFMFSWLVFGRCQVQSQNQ